MSAHDEGTRVVDPSAQRDFERAESVLDLRPGVLLGGRFLIRDRLGAGGSGAVYSALDTAVGQKVAVKVLRPELADELNHERLRREVRASRPGHPGIVTVFDLHQHDGFLFLSMELVGGRSLRELLAERRTLPVDEAVAIGARVATALAHLHERGLVHRDVKPGNILVTPDGAAKLCDLGLARPVAEGTTVTETAMVVGTPAYMAPEQATAAGLTPASDVYALGLTLYRCLTGTVPLEGTTAVETLMLRQHARPPRLQRGSVDAPRWLGRLLRRMLEPDPRERPGAAVVAAALRARSLSWRPGRRQLKRAALAAAAVFALVVAAVVVERRLAAPSLDPTARLMFRVESFDNGSSVDILDDRGNRLHRMVLGRHWDPDAVGRNARRIVAFGDLDGDGLEDAVIARQDQRAEPLEVFLRLEDGSLAEPLRYPPSSGFSYQGRSFDPFQPIDVHCNDLDADGRAEIVLVEHSTAYYPATVRVLDWRNETLFRLWHPGQLTSAQTADRDRDGRPELYIGGTCNFLTAPESNTSKPVFIALEHDWRRRGQTVDLFAPDRRLPAFAPAGVRLMYAAWDRVVTPRYRDSWQNVMVAVGPANDPATFLSLVVSEASPVNLGLSTRKRPALRHVQLDRQLRVSDAQWEPLIIDLLDIEPEDPEMQGLLLPQYWTGDGWSGQPIFMDGG